MIEIYPNSSTRHFSAEYLQRLELGWGEVFSLLQSAGVGVIVELKLIEICLLDDREMARLHGQFLNDETTTDVITFDHGELMIGVEVAARQALEYDTSADREIALYGIHGMLHLAGFDDHDPHEAEKMAGRQGELLRAFFADLE